MTQEWVRLVSHDLVAVPTPCKQPRHSLQVLELQQSSKAPSVLVWPARIQVIRMLVMFLNNYMYMIEFMLEGTANCSIFT